ncbi:MAG: hypothetical protein LAQ69_00750 [Acidobacteriia bacterium]|nr:hypothetical protein [Terriglobia bacterium]
MTRRTAVVLLSLNVLGGLLPLFGDEAARKPVEITHTERVNFAPGGVIRLVDSFGSLKVEGWDRPEVEITVIKSMDRYYEAKQQEQAARRLERVRIVADRRSDSELTISTILPRKLFEHLLGKTGATLDKVTGTARHPLGGKGGGLVVEYQIHAPRDSKLVVHHGTGQVLIGNMTGDVEATSRGGDILVMLPDTGTYSIDARSKFGAVSSDFDGASHRRHIVGSGFARAVPAPSRRIYLRTGMGGITIQAVPVEAEEPASARTR